MKWIAAAGVALVCWLGISGTAFGATLNQLVPNGYFNSDPSFLTSPPDDPRIFVAERGENNSADVRIVENGTGVATPFLTVSNVGLESERGLMSIAFDPGFASNRIFYLFYTANGPDGLDPEGQAGDVRIVQYRASADDPNQADASSARLVLRVRHSAGNHNGGWMAFGPDGHLYISIGDNGNGANAQNLGNLLGKILRIDPAEPPATGYTVPPDNPFVSTGGARGEIWTYGLRNPYRASFAPDGRLTIGDVGNGAWEEIDAGDLKGRNMGWPNCEGFCSPANPNFTEPVFAYNHQNSVDGFGGGCAVIGGHVVEDPALDDLVGRYIYGDLCHGELRSIDLDTPGGDFRKTGLNTFGNPIAFGQDSNGCSYVLTSTVYRIAASENPDTACRPPEEPPVDVTYNSYIPRRQVMGQRLTVGAKCSIACGVRATAEIKISRNRFRREPATFKLRTGPRNLIADQRGNLTFRVPLKRVKAMKKAALGGSKVTARVKVTMVGVDTSGGSGESTIRLVRPKRR